MMLFKKTFLPASLVAAMLASGCSVNIERDALVQDGKQAAEAKSERAVPDNGKTELQLNGQSLREQAIENNYYAYYFQKTVYESYHDILNQIEPMSGTLNEIFNFGQLAYEGKMLPPIIEESFDYLGVQNEKSMVKTERRWKIIKDAKVIATVPVWQDYLFSGMKVEPNKLNPTLEPKTDEEIAASQKGKERGIKEGKDYVVALFNANLARLSKDFLGMLTYKKLEVQGIVKPPILAVSDEPFVYTNGNKEVSVGTQRYLITQDSSFQSHNQWKPIVSSGQVVNERDTVFNPPSYQK
jgi:defect-in-organelle-trafficking protein DotC